MDISTISSKIYIMTLENQLLPKNFSMAKAILAVLWQAPEIGKERLFTHKYLSALCGNKHKNTYRSCVHRLQKAGLVQRDYNKIIALTEEGEKRARFAFIEAESALHKIGEPRWDGGWRIVFFDIPESKRKYRDYFRKVLKLVGFVEFQRSIWAYPYPVPDFLKDLMLEKSIKSHIKFITTNVINDDTDLRDKFGLF